MTVTYSYTDLWALVQEHVLKTLFSSSELSDGL